MTQLSCKTLDKWGINENMTLHISEGHRYQYIFHAMVTHPHCAEIASIPSFTTVECHHTYHAYAASISMKLQQ